mgnify:CR=1 FL=1
MQSKPLTLIKNHHIKAFSMGGGAKMYEAFSFDI